MATKKSAAIFIVSATLAHANAASAEYRLWAQDNSRVKVPPSWDLTPSTRTRRTDAATAESSSGKAKRPWWKPRLALGAGLGVPDLLPIEGYLLFGRYAALRLFYSPPVPINGRVEMPSDVVSSKKGVGVAHPDFIVHLKAVYGPQFGADFLGFPFGGSFFVGAGASLRKVRLTGSARSSVLICSLIEAAKEPPCGNPEARLESLSQLTVKADVQSTAMIARASLGGFWHVGRYGYFTLSVGAAKPYHVTKSVNVNTGIDGPSQNDEDLSGALADLKREKDEELEQKALGELRPALEKLLPIAAMSAGVRF